MSSADTRYDQSAGAFVLTQDKKHDLSEGEICVIPHPLFVKGNVKKKSALLTLTQSKVAPPKELTGADVFVGLGWTIPGKAAAIDLDVSCIASDGQGRLACIASYESLRAIPGVEHTGDDSSGKGGGGGDNERIFFDLDKVPWGVKELHVCVNIFSNHSFADLTNAYVRLVAVHTGVCLCQVCPQV